MKRARSPDALTVSSVARADPNEGPLAKRYGITVKVVHPEWWTDDERALYDATTEMLAYVRRYADVWRSRATVNANTLREASAYLTGIVHLLSRKQAAATQADFAHMRRSEEVRARYPTVAESILACMRLPKGVARITDAGSGAAVDLLADRARVKQLGDAIVSGMVRQYKYLPPRISK